MCPQIIAEGKSSARLPRYMASVFRCAGCGCTFVYTADDPAPKEHDDQRDGYSVEDACPFCGQRRVFAPHAPRPDDELAAIVREVDGRRDPSQPRHDGVPWA